ncbi:MAG TPA: hypothetical protein VGK67_28775 [Myxococcales bacterium]|jgi:hypothetical protein
MTRRLVPLLALFALFVSVPAVAHAPGMLHADQTTVLENPKASRILVGTFRTGSELFVARLTFETGFATPFEIFTPHREELRNFRPAYAVVCQGLPIPPMEVQTRLPRPLPEGAGAFVDFNELVPRPVLWEFVMRRVYWTTDPTAVPLPAGDCDVWIWSPSKQRGPMALGVGVEEKFGMQAVSDLFENWSDYAY